MEFKKLNKFKQWLNETVKNYHGNYQDYVYDLVNQFGQTGNNTYELSARETISGQPVDYEFSVSYEDRLLQDGTIYVTIIF